MMPTLSSKDRRAVALGVASIGSVMIAAQGIPRWREWDADRRVAATTVLARAAEFERALIVPASMADNARRAAKEYDALATSVLQGDTPTASSAQLAEIVSAAADEAAARVTTLQIRPDTVFRDRFARVGVRMAGVGDIVALVNLLESLEMHETLMSVRELSVSQPDPAAAEGRPEALRFQLLVEALAVPTKVKLAPTGGGK